MFTNDTLDKLEAILLSPRNMWIFKCYFSYNWESGNKVEFESETYLKIGRYMMMALEDDDLFRVSAPKMGGTRLDYKKYEAIAVKEVREDFPFADHPPLSRWFDQPWAMSFLGYFAALPQHFMEKCVFSTEFWDRMTEASGMVSSNLSINISTLRPSSPYF